MYQRNNNILCPDNQISRPASGLILNFGTHTHKLRHEWRHALVDNNPTTQGTCPAEETNHDEIKHFVLY